MDQQTALQSLINALQLAVNPAREAFDQAELKPRENPKEWGVDLGLSEPIPVKAAYNCYRRILDRNSVKNSSFNTDEARKFFRIAGFTEVSISSVEWKKLIYGGSGAENLIKSNEELEDIILLFSRESSKKSSRVINVRERCHKLRRYVYNRSQGICEFCSQPAPFKDKKGQYFVEVHHINRLADDGIDHPENAIALCPNCHRESHYGEKSVQINTEMSLRAKTLWKKAKQEKA